MVSVAIASVEQFSRSRTQATSKPIASRQCHSMLQKTQLCKFFVVGKCKKGLLCTFAHEKQELRSQPDLSCTKLCPSLMGGGKCRNPHCGFAHELTELRKPPRVFPGVKLASPVLDLAGLRLNGKELALVQCPSAASSQTDSTEFVSASHMSSGAESSDEDGVTVPKAVLTSQRAVQHRSSPSLQPCEPDNFESTLPRLLLDVEATIRSAISDYEARRCAAPKRATHFV